MFVRVKKSGTYEYLQIVHNQRIDGAVRQQVVATLGRLDVLRSTGQLDALLHSCAKFSEHVAILDATRQEDFEPQDAVRLGPPLVFGRLWEELGLPQVIQTLLEGRKFQFSVERALFMTVLHRLMVSGSDRAAECWCRGYALSGMEELELHHLYRAMGWLGESLPQAEQPTDQRLGPRCRKDLIEQRLFARRRDLFQSLELVFFDTTSIYFEGEGGESLGQYGYSKDHRPDRKQMVVGAVLDNTGRPLCCFLLPGNTADITTLIPVIDQLKERFGIHDVCVVADRGMISQETIEQLEGRSLRYILGARLRQVKEIREEVLSRGGRYHVVHGPREVSKDPSPLKVKEVSVDGRRYVVCHNEDQAAKDRHDREAIVAKLEEQLHQGAKSLVGNKGFRKYLRATGEAFAVDTEKVQEEARFDGKWVLRTNTDLATADVALKYKDLLLVESLFRSMKSILETRPIYHKCDDTIRGHVFCSFLALLLMKELQLRLEKQGHAVEWRRLLDDLEALQEFMVTTGGKTFVVRTATRGDAGKALGAVGVALGPKIRQQ